MTRPLHGYLRELDSALVCFSGGVDSSYLLAEAVAALGTRAIAFTAVSPSLAPEEKEAAAALAQRLGAEHLLVATHELDDARYQRNPVNRCYFCKTEVYGTATRLAKERGIAHVLDGFNVDDRGDHRPGRRAAKELGVRSPLDDLGFRKADIRREAEALGLPVWDKPALACLASRFPYGTAITPGALAQIARAERHVRAMGFSIVRVRYFGSLARVEVDAAAVPRLQARRPELVQRLEACGFSAIEIDPKGYRRGALNVLR
ncbi:MAG: ATP-dependent sacrificial sulfur transferase LarE [Myxococcota bacterium]